MGIEGYKLLTSAHKIAAEVGRVMLSRSSRTEVPERQMEGRRFTNGKRMLCR
jgi:hypothetical protein